MSKSESVSTAAPHDPTATRPQDKRDVRNIVRIVAAVVILALLVAFVLDNSHSVTVGFVFFSARVPLIWVLLVTALLGMVVDRLLVWQRSQHRKAAAKAKSAGR